MKIYQTERGAQDWLTILGPEPWKAFNQDPDDGICCSGDMCGCGGVTVREHWEEKREEMPRLEFVRLEFRSVPQHWSTEKR